MMLLLPFFCSSSFEKTSPFTAPRRSGFDNHSFLLSHPRSDVLSWTLLCLKSKQDMLLQALQRSHPLSFGMWIQSSKWSLYLLLPELHCVGVRLAMNTREGTFPLSLRSFTFIFERKGLKLNLHGLDGVPGSDVCFATFPGAIHRHLCPILDRPFTRPYVAYVVGCFAEKRHTLSVSYGKNLSLSPRPPDVSLLSFAFSGVALSTDPSISFLSQSVQRRRYGGRRKEFNLISKMGLWPITYFIKSPPSSRIWTSFVGPHLSKLLKPNDFKIFKLCRLMFIGIIVFFSCILEEIELSVRRPEEVTFHILYVI